jgi:hypothetical protein
MDAITGPHVPMVSPKKVSVKLDRPRYQALKQLGLRRDLPSQALLVQALDAYLADSVGGGAAAKPAANGARTPGADRQEVYAVSGQAQGEVAADAEAQTWLDSVWRSEEGAQARVKVLTDALHAAAVGIAAPEDLVGLSTLQRRALQDSLRSLDPRAQIGRHGVTWTWRAVPLG